MHVPISVQLDQQRRADQYARDNPAEAVFEAIKRQIKQFMVELEDDESLAMQLNNNGGMRINVENVSYATPSLICFDGETSDGDFARVFQSVSQLNFTLVAVKLQGGEKKPPIGFIHPDED